MKRDLRVVEEVSRKRLSDTYLENMTLFLTKTRNVTKEQAEEFISNTIRNSIVLPTFDVVETVTSGKIERRKMSFKTFSDIAESCIVTPSGSVYTPVNKKRSFISTLIKEGLAMRSVVKKKMFKAIAEGRKEDATKYKAEQNTIKIKLNALPGGFGSPSNLFYDKGGYNAVTSTARMLISNSFTCCEQFLGGNLPLFNVEEIFNLITTAKEVGPSNEDVYSVMNDFKLHTVTVDELFDYFKQQVEMYVPGVDLIKAGVYDYLKTMPSHTIQFLYYHTNLQHIVFKNDKLFRDKITEMFTYDPNVEIPSSIIPEQFFKCDGDIMAIVTTVVSKELESVSMKDIVELHPEQAKLCIYVHKHITKCLQDLFPIFKVFVYHDLNFQNVLHRSLMQRKSVVVSDTDSVIYTSKDWAEWYTGTIDKLTHDSYSMAALVTYWLTEVNADVMAKYIIGIGAVGADIPTIKMKNEFLYPSLLLFDIKKVYAGIIKVQEGVIMPSPKPDIKGSSIRGSAASAEAKEFVKKMLVEDILKPVADGNISANTLITKTMDFEDKIWSSLQNGELNFLPIVSVGTSDSYDEEDRTAYFYAKAWNFIFGKKYGIINPPDKLRLVKITAPNELYLSQLKLIDSDIHDRFVQFIADNKKAPSAFFIETTQSVIPKELLPIVNIRHIVHTNVNPVYLTLESLNIGVGYSSNQLLLSDIYGSTIRR